MSQIIAPGTPVPDFRLTRGDGSEFTQADIEGKTAVLVFFPNAFSPVCSDQFQVYQEVLEDFEAQGGTLYGVSTDQFWSQNAFKESLGVTIEMLSDFEPKGETSRKFGAFFEPAGFSHRALVVTGPDGLVKWSWEGEHPGVLPGANLVFDGLRAAAS